MPVYRVGYDLKKPGQNYPELVAALSKVGRRLLKSDWVIDVEQTAVQVMDAVRSHIDRGDDVVVTEIAADADWATFARVNNAGVAMLMRRRP